MKNNVPYTIRAVLEEDYVPEGDGHLNAASLLVLRLDAEKNRNKAMEKLRDNSTIFYITLWDSLSVESQQIVRAHEDFEEADLEQDPNSLWLIITSTHLTNANGGGDEMRLFDRIQLEREFAAFSQKNLSIGIFITKFTEWKRTLVGAGVAETQQPQLALEFLSKLDAARYGSMMTDLTNQAMRGIALPQTLAEAYTVASNWRILKSPGSSQETQSVFVLADDNRGKSDNRGGRGGRGGRDGRNQAENRGGGGGREGRGRRGRGGSAEATPNRNAGGRGKVGSEGAEGFKEYRTCRICLKKGHLAKDCPDNAIEVPNLALVGVGEIDYDDEDGEYEANYVVVPRTEDCKQESCSVLFTSTEVLLDNQASQSVFSNEMLLHELEDIVPYHIGGIDGSQAGGLRIAQAGSFKDLEGVAGTV